MNLKLFHSAGKPLLSLALEFEMTLISLSWNRSIVRFFPSLQAAKPEGQ